MTDKKSKQKKVLGLSTRKLTINVPSEKISSSITSHGKNTVVVVTKTKPLNKIEGNRDEKNMLTEEEKQNRLKAIIESEVTKNLEYVNNNSYHNDESISNSKGISNIKNLDYNVTKKKQEKVEISTQEKVEISTQKKEVSKSYIENKIVANNNNKKKFTKLKDKENIPENKRESKKIKNIGIDKEGLRNLSVTKIYDLEKESENNECKTKVTKIIPKVKSKYSRNDKQEKIYREIKIYDHITVQELAGKMAEKPNTVIKVLKDLGFNLISDQLIDPDTAEVVIQSLGHKPIIISNEEIKKTLIDQVEDLRSILKPRPPIVTIMGHVDHGKTSLLDALRSTNIASEEQGGITQHIGAYNVTLNSNKSITFLDTPGHSAFTAMRMRGAKITDIVIIVIAIEDGIKEQTIEAINHAKAAEVPIIIAINKVDKSKENIKTIKNSLLEHSIIPDDMGGDTIVIPVSAKLKIGLESLIEAILIQSEMLDLRVNPNKRAEGVVIESKLDKLKGPLATLLVQQGTLEISNIVIIGNDYCKIRALINDKGNKVSLCFPSTAVKVLGMNKVPQAGEKFIVVKNEKIARKILDLSINRTRKNSEKQPSIDSFNNLLEKQKKNAKLLNIIIKTDVNGSLEAIKLSLQRLSTDKVEIKIIHSMVGAVNESDVSLAKVTGSIILGFNVEVENNVIKLAKNADVTIKCYSIIYEIITYIKSLINNLIPFSPIKNVIGCAQVRNIIRISKVGNIAGCIVIEGIIRKKAYARLIRNNNTIHENKIHSLKRFKNSVKEVKMGFECGISLEKFSDFKEKDKIEVYEITTDIKKH